MDLILIVSPIAVGECLEFLINSQKYSFANIAGSDFADGQFKSGLSIEVIKIMNGWDVACTPLASSGSNEFYVQLC